ncbi:MAG TPA: aldehyde dehydrogenase family protein [Gemmatimonadales bacterium]|nr:aldehyde dehydrogenase family protein [Gemmatimonadales bacterium]
MSTIPAIDPVSGRTFAESPVTSLTDLPALVDRARRAQSVWSRRPLADRLRVVRRFQRRLFDRRQELAALVARENGKPAAESILTEVAVTLDLARYYLRTARTILRPTRIRFGNPAFLGRRGRVYWEPVGVVGVISPWNYPLMLPFGEILPALLAGNAVLFKPSEFTLQTGRAGAELLWESGLDPDLCQLIVGAGEAGAALIGAGLDKIFFTGSVATGRKVAVAAAERLLPVNLELGGSDPCIVLADADLDRAASGVVWARFTNAGQTCVAAKRVVVERAVAQRFVDLLVAKAEALRLGTGPDVDMGPLIRPAQVNELERQIAASVDRGARVVTGGHRRPDLGATFFAPTILVDVPVDSPLWREEVFGPALPVVAVADQEEAVRIANASAYGLSASIWTGDRRRGERLARRLVAGAIMVNDAASHVGAAEVPHGGVRESGIGRTHGAHGLLEMCVPRFVGSDLFDRMRKPWWFGYTAESAANRDAFLRFAFAPSFWQRLRAAPRALGLLINRRPI